MINDQLFAGTPTVVGPVYCKSTALYVAPPSVEISIFPVAPAANTSASQNCSVADDIPTVLKTGVSSQLFVVPDVIANFPFVCKLLYTAPLGANGCLGPLVSLHGNVEALSAFAGKIICVPFCQTCQPFGFAKLNVPSMDEADPRSMESTVSVDVPPRQMVEGVALAFVGG